MTKHTYGQLLVLTLGANENWERAKKSTARESKQEEGRQKRGKRLQPPKDFSKMTGRQYMEYVNRRSGGKF